MCQHSLMKRRGAMHMSRIIDLIYHFGHKVQEIIPFGMQEPLLDPRLSMILANIKQMNPAVHILIFSNMGYFPEKQLRQIIRWGTLDLLEVSFYGTDETVYGELQPPLNFEQTRQNILRLMQLKRELGRTLPKVDLMMLATPRTYDKVKSWAREWQPLVDSVSSVHYDGWCGKQPYSPEIEKLLWNSPGQEVRTPCPRLWTGMYVHYDGTVVPCCLDSDDEEPLGNIFEDWNLWHTSKRLNEIRTLHEQRRFSEIPLCKDCVTWRYGYEKEWNKFWMNVPLP
jgi:radical SAM protein with 4Fe4S-binding SPASM domain